MSPVDEGPLGGPRTGADGSSEDSTSRSEGCASFESRLEAYLDGELEPEELERFAGHLAHCEACRDQFELARALRSELRSLPHASAPERIVERVLALARSEAGRPVGRGARVDSSRWSRAVRPAVLVALAASLLVAGVLLVPRIRDSGTRSSLAEAPAPAVDAATIDQAGAEARLALSYVSTVTRRTGLRIRNEIVGRELIGSAARGLELLSPHKPNEEAPRNHEI